jgi:AcrR family transcriptional regulator
MTTIREKKKASTREALLASAQELFLKQGFQKTTVEEIAEGAVTTKFTFYQYFQSKDEVLEELHTEGIKKAMGGSGVLIEQGLPLAVVLEQLVSNFADYYDENKDLARMYFSLRRMPLSPVKKADSCLTNLVALLKSGQDSGEFSSEQSAEDIARYMYMICYSEKVSWIDSDCSYPLKEKMVSAVKLLLHGLLK